VGWIGFRPEEFQPRIGPLTNSRSDVVLFRFRINRIEYLGAEQLIYGTLEGRPDDKILISRLPIAMQMEIEPGKIYEFTVPCNAVERFERGTGRRLNGASL
jgi:multiple sugar transport system ATP-binding protein